MTHLNGPKRTMLSVALALPLMGAKGDGCASNSRSPAPDVSGSWNIEYDDMLDVEIKIGGAVYNESLGANGGVIEITHDGNPLSFDLDCEKPEIVCPSEAWPSSISVEQRNAQFEHRMIVTLPTQQCAGTMRDAEPDECGPGTLNEECERVCEGEITLAETERFGVIGEDGSSFRLYLGAGVATNGINCALLGVSLADAELENTGSADDETWRSVAMNAGLVTVGYAGGCLWAGDPNMDGELEALVLSASVTFQTGFTGSRSAPTALAW